LSICGRKDYAFVIFGADHFQTLTCAAARRAIYSRQV
jgi:hypothetical protein